MMLTFYLIVVDFDGDVRSSRQYLSLIFLMKCHYLIVYLYCVLLHLMQHDRGLPALYCLINERQTNKVLAFRL